MSHFLTRQDLARLAAFRQQLRGRRFRGLLWVSEAPDRARGVAHECLAQGGWSAPLWVGETSIDEAADRAGNGAPDRAGTGAHARAGNGAHDRAGNPPPSLERLPAAKARTRLGGEHDLVVFDAASPGTGLDPDALGAVAGTLVAGGLLVLLTADDGGRRPDDDYRRLAAHPWRPEQLTSRYLERCHRLLAGFPGMLRWRQGEGLTATPDDGQESPFADGSCSDNPCPDSPCLDSPDPDCLSPDQAEVVRRLTRLRRRRPLVITADRGRGKSAALGIACARLLVKAEQQRQAPLDILVTAPRASSVAPVFERLAALLPEGQGDERGFEAPGGRVRFIAPDALTDAVARGEAGGPGSLLLVDEAAAIPAALLGEWLAAFPRLAFATTVHGYEGSGRGFALRFRRHLEAQTPQWQDIALRTPIRWADGDPLERAIDALLCLDAELPTVPKGARVSAPCPGQKLAELPCTTLDRDVLARDEASLRAIFGLLVQAHYRTTPADLRVLLDAPATRISILGTPRAPLAVCVYVDEGGFDADLAERVLLGRRRPRGHLMAQSLAAHAGEAAALKAPSARITRIAVHPDWRRLGCGARLIQEAACQAEQAGKALLGASFGADPELLAFWQAQGFRPVRLGLTREAATGEHAVMVALALGEHNRDLIERLSRRFERQLPGLLAFELTRLSPPLVLALLASVGDRCAFDADDRRELQDLARGQREPALARPAIQALVRRLASLSLSPPMSSSMSKADDDHDSLAWLAAWAFQGRSESSLAQGLSLRGKAQVKQWLRDAVGRALALLETLSKAPVRG
ncbi:GNAT family N-acetyltransferase [uncultured Halomonas sp.]|uniref:GNAT family N-acetyltransferase n=1 Tax=uncultured Halomonas sp. TaxID=173971 RepID=UPI0025993ED2|nr:GNAT family N-acetyltransferase [uncultured Halomonas sp.]